MKTELEEIIRMLEKAQDLIYKKKYEEANTIIYRAQSQAIYIKELKS